MKRSEYEPKAEEFRAFLMAEGEKPRDEQVWPEFEEWLSIPGTSTCTTPSCPAFNVADPVVLHENADGIYRGQCGACGNPTQPVPTFEDD